MRDGGPKAAAPLEAAHGSSLRSKTPLGSSSSSVCSSSGGRVRPVRLMRRPGETYGFSLRGGREHGTGFFISHVELGSEAFLQGLRAGDQLVRVNNMAVDQAVHREVTAMVQSKASVLLHIRSTGIIPLKEHRGDPLTWLVVDDDEELSDHGTDSYSGPSVEATPPPHHRNHHPHAHPANYARVYLSFNGRVGLGCSICKGPPEKPGIFVQSVKVGGVARNAGLRPGDQVIACNDVSFAHLEFAEAVYVLKSSPRLVLDVLHGAGLELVAGESSGYNSSASSVAGDQTPPSSSSSDPRDSDHSVTSRLSAVSRHLTLDRSRGWQEIEDEWAEAEAADKRKALQASQKILKTRAQRDASHRLSNIASRSLSSLSAALREEEYEEQRTAFRDPKPSPLQPTSQNLPSHSTLKSTLRGSKSIDDLSEDTSHKIALLTSADPHVNNIVVTGGPKDERDAVFRLEQLSSASASRTSTLSSGTSQVTVRSSSGSGGGVSPGRPVPSQSSESLVEQQLQELRREQKRLQDEANRLAEERRRFEDVRRIEAKLDQLKKDRPKSGPVDPKMAQHAKLMEEIKMKQKKMLTKDNIDAGAKTDEKEKEETVKECPSARDPSPPPPPVAFSSKIINRSKAIQNKDKEVNHGSNANAAPLTNGITTTPATTPTNTITKSRVNIGGAPSKLPLSRTSTVPVKQVTTTSPKPPVFATQQWSERMRGSVKGPSPAVPSKPRPHSTIVSSSSMEEFRPEDKAPKAIKPPSAYFEPQKKTSGKPLVSISAYPSPNQRPTPVKMDFLPQSSAKVEVNGVNVVDGPSSKAVLQNELKSTLTRSNLRQRSTAEQVFEGPLPPPASSSSSSSSSTKPSFTTTTIVNTATPPKASLSSKYSYIGQNNTGVKERL